MNQAHKHTLIKGLIDAICKNLDAQATYQIISRKDGTSERRIIITYQDGGDGV